MSASPSGNPSRRSLFDIETVAVPLFLLLLWGQLFWCLHPTWIHGQYYDYGWIVPPVFFWFFWRRWQSETGHLARPSRPATLSLALVGLGLLLLLSLSFLRILERFDPIWRVPQILHGGTVFLTTLTVLALVTGVRSSLAYLPVVLFGLTAVPWPAQIENLLIEELTERLLGVAAPLARLVGIPAGLSGSALLAEGRLIQIDEGCSGIRSFQSLIMAGFFFGEFLLLRPVLRVILLVFAILVGFATNTLRAVTLAWIFFHEGDAAFDRAHDLVGFAAFGLAALLLLGLGSLLDALPLRSTRQAAPSAA